MVGGGSEFSARPLAVNRMSDKVIYSTCVNMVSKKVGTTFNVLCRSCKNDLNTY